MPTYSEQIEASVDTMITQGRIQSTMRDQYINLLTANDKVAEYFGTGFMQAGDYTRKTQGHADQVRTWQAQQEAERAKFQKDRTDLEQWQKQAQTEFDRMKGLEQQFPTLTAKIAAYEQILKDYGLTEQVQIPNLPQGESSMPNNNNNGNSFQAQGSPVSPGAKSQTADYITREDVAAFARELINLQGKALRITARHQQLFGAPLVDDIVSEAMAAGQEPEHYWATKYNVPAKESELAKQAIDVEKVRMEAEIRAKVMAELAIDPSRVLTPHGLQSVSSKGAVLDRYAASRALEYNPLTGASTADPSQPLISPEKLPNLSQTISRINEAKDFFNKTFNSDGTPLNGGGPTQGSVP